MKRLAAIVAVLLLAGRSAAGTVTVRDDDDLRRALAQAKPGTTIRIAPGTYRGGLSAKLRGEARRPIVVAAADPDRPPVIRGGNAGLHLVRAVHVELRSLVLEGAEHNGLNIDDGGRIDEPAHHVTLVDLVVRDVGAPGGNRDGIKLSGLDDFRIEGCRVERWGSGGSGIDLVGCHRGEIVRCLLRHEEGKGGSGVQLKGGCREVAIRRCRFEHAGQRAVNLGGSTGRAYFRPRDPGHEAKDLLVEDCTFVGSLSPVAYVGVDGAVVRHCTIYRPRRWVLRILQESRGEDFVACRNGVFESNVVAWRSDELSTTVNVGPGTEPESFRFARNVWTCLDAPGRSRPRLPVKERDGVHGVEPRFVDAEGGDLRLRRGSPAQRAGVRPEKESDE